ncbi:MAG: NVEALA domain-containing protein [Bacteroides sp.]|nr:NVEALA domain-containing protein [Bacteroides sp.]
MKKNIMYATAIIIVATILAIKAERTKPMSDIVLANVEALADNEGAENQYYCYGTGSVRCPYSGKLVAGYIKRYNLK